MSNIALTISLVGPQYLVGSGTPPPTTPDGAILTEDGLYYLITEDGVYSLQQE